MYATLASGAYREPTLIANDARPRPTMHFPDVPAQAWEIARRGVYRCVNEPGGTAQKFAKGDRVLVSGRVGDHGTAILLARGALGLSAEVRSDTQSLWPLADALLAAAGASVRCMRNAARGGVATVLNQLSAASGVGVAVREEAVPVQPAVMGACELLGIDPLYMANEGTLVAVVARDAAPAALAALREVPGGEEAAEIGEVRAEPAGMVLMRSGFGGTRVMDLLVGDPLPRIC
jgi:hydrogenase expression/formation protein HypE